MYSIKAVAITCLLALATTNAENLRGARQLATDHSNSTSTFIDGDDTVVFAADGTCTVNTAAGSEEQCKSFKEKQDKMTKDMNSSMAKMKADMAKAFGSNHTSETNLDSLGDSLDSLGNRRLTTFCTVNGKPCSESSSLSGGATDHSNSTSTFIDGDDTVVFAADGTCTVNTAAGSEEQCKSFKEKQDKMTKDMNSSMAKMKADMAKAFGSNHTSETNLDSLGDSLDSLGNRRLTTFCTVNGKPCSESSSLSGGATDHSNSTSTFIDGDDTVVFAADGTCTVNTAAGSEEQCKSFKEKQDKMTKDMNSSMAKMKADMAKAFGSNHTSETNLDSLGDSLDSLGNRRLTTFCTVNGKPCSESSSLSGGAIFGIIVGVFALLAAAVVLYTVFVRAPSSQTGVVEAGAAAAAAAAAPTV